MGDGAFPPTIGVRATVSQHHSGFISTFVPHNSLPLYPMAQASDGPEPLLTSTLALHQNITKTCT